MKRLKENGQIGKGDKRELSVVYILLCVSMFSSFVIKSQNHLVLETHGGHVDFNPSFHRLSRKLYIISLTCVSPRRGGIELFVFIQSELFTKNNKNREEKDVKDLS